MHLQLVSEGGRCWQLKRGKRHMGKFACESAYTHRIDLTHFSKTGHYHGWVKFAADNQVRVGDVLVMQRRIGLLPEGNPKNEVMFAMVSGDTPGLQLVLPSEEEFNQFIKVDAVPDLAKRAAAAVGNQVSYCVFIFKNITMLMEIPTNYIQKLFTAMTSHCYRINSKSALWADLMPDAVSRHHRYASTLYRSEAAATAT